MSIASVERSYGPFITDLNMLIDDVAESRTPVWVELAKWGNGKALIT